VWARLSCLDWSLKCFRTSREIIAQRIGEAETRNLTSNLLNCGIFQAPSI
jgi:hypothetical protein